MSAVSRVIDRSGEESKEHEQKALQRAYCRDLERAARLEQICLVESLETAKTGKETCRREEVSMIVLALDLLVDLTPCVEVKTEGLSTSRIVSCALTSMPRKKAYSKYLGPRLEASIALHMIFAILADIQQLCFCHVSTLCVDVCKGGRTGQLPDLSTGSRSAPRPA